LYPGEQKPCASSEACGSGNDDRIHMKERQTTERYFARLHQISGASHRPSHIHLIAVGVRRNLGHAGGAARVEVAGDIVYGNHAAAQQAVIRLLRNFLVEIEHRDIPDPVFRWSFSNVVRLSELAKVDLEHRLERRHFRQDGANFCPETKLGFLRQRDQHARLNCLENFCDLLSFEELVGGGYDPGRFSAPNHIVGLWQIRQNVCDNRSRPDTQAMKKIRCLENLPE
jgi:hypothetical protein